MSGPSPLPEGYRIQRATLLDLRAVHDLERRIFPRDAYPYADLVLLFLMPSIVNLKIVAPDRSLAGFVSSVHAPLRQRGWIITLGVHPAHQRRGLGRVLLAAAERRLRQPHVRLTVREGNVPALTLYRHTGYTIIERRPGYYRDGETGLIMEKSIDAP